MTVKTVLEYPNEKLRQICQPITQAMADNGQLKQLVTDLKESMYATPGTVGLAAPQIGECFQAFVMDASANGDHALFKVVINPVFKSQSKWKYGREGCLSFPKYLITLKRARKITVEYLNEHFEKQEATLEDFEAIIFQHEYDHLQGILFIDLARNLETDLVLRNEPSSVSQ